MLVSVKDLKYFSPLKVTVGGQKVALHFISYDNDILNSFILKTAVFEYSDNVIETMCLFFGPIRAFRAGRGWNFAKISKQITSFSDSLSSLSPALLSKAIQLGMGFAVRGCNPRLPRGKISDPIGVAPYPRTAASPSVPIRLSLAGSVV